MQSSTIVRKYQWPREVGTEKGPYISACIRSNGLEAKELLSLKHKRRCLAKGQVVQWKLVEVLMAGS